MTIEASVSHAMEAESNPVLRHATEANVAVIELTRPPHNFVNADVMRALADAFDDCDADDDCRAIVLASGLRTFCAGADFSGSERGAVHADPAPFYAQALRLFRNRKPVVAAIQGPAVGAGLGIALAADFRVTCEEARFSANFNRLGFHPGFGLSVTLPRLVGQQHAARMFFTGRRIGGEEAVAIGLADELVPVDEVRYRALALASEIALSAPLAVESTRQTLRMGLADEIVAVNQRELAEQRVQFATEDFREGVAAMAERREPKFRRR